MRYFLALELDSESRRISTLIQQSLQSVSTRVKWVHPLNLHVTIHFFGELDSERLEKSIMVIESSLHSMNHVLHFHLASVDAFPSICHPRVIVMKLGGDIDELAGMQKILCANLKRNGFDIDMRAFIPHVTIGRVMGNCNELAQEIGKDINFKGNHFCANRLVLMQSILTPNGPQYKCERHFSFCL
jgi:2'-5' RNA ligase